MLNNYIPIDSPNDIGTALELAVDCAKNNNEGYRSYWGGIIMLLPTEKQFTDILRIRNLKTREMEDHIVTITHAFCGLILEIKESGSYHIVCHALNESEGYFCNDADSLFAGVFFPITTDIVIVKIALQRFFSSGDFKNTGASDPLTRSVIPLTIPDKTTTQVSNDD